MWGSAKLPHLFAFGAHTLATRSAAFHGCQQSCRLCRAIFNHGLGTVCEEMLAPWVLAGWEGQVTSGMLHAS